MLELIDGTPDKEFYYDNVLKRLDGGEDNWDTVQRFRFAACLGLEAMSRQGVPCMRPFRQDLKWAKQ